MDRSSLELRVGLITIIAIIILVVGSIWGKDVRLSSAYQHINFKFKHSGGLRTGDPVTVNGVKKGRVQEVLLIPDGVIIATIIDQDVALNNDVRAAISMQDLMGSTMLEVFPGTSGVVLNAADLAQPIEGQEVVSLSILFQDVERMKNRVDSLVTGISLATASVNELLSEEEVIQPLKNSVANVYQASDRLNKLVANNSGAIDSILISTQNTTKQLNAIFERRGTQLENSLETMSSVIARLDTFSLHLQNISAKIDQKDGTVAKLIYSNETYDQLQSTIAGVDSLSKHLKANLGRYLDDTNVNLFNFLKF